MEDIFKNLNEEEILSEESLARACTSQSNRDPKEPILSELEINQLIAAVSEE